MALWRSTQRHCRCAVDSASNDITENTIITTLFFTVHECVIGFSYSSVKRIVLYYLYVFVPIPMNGSPTTAHNRYVHRT